MKTLVSSILSLILLLAASAALAVKVELLYQGQVLVASQSDDEQNRAIPSALLQVLTKVSGNIAIANNPEIKANLSHAAKWVTQVGYPKANVLSVDFDSIGVTDLLRKANSPMWGQNRPLILVWIDYEKSGHPAEIVGSDSNNEIVTLLKHNAELNGLPIIFPLMDLTDINQVSVNDVANMTVPTLQTAAKRYAGDVLLIGKITQGKNDYSSQWKLISDSSQSDWNLSGNTLDEIFSTLMRNTLSTLGTRYAVMTSSVAQGELTLTVSGITQQMDFAQLMNYLNHLTPVASVNIKQVSDSSVVLNISLRGSQQSFSQLLVLGKKLTPINAAEWTYQWNH